MALYHLENLSFSYPNQEVSTLHQLNLTIEQGDFVIICGQSGSGKTTLLRHLKTVLSPHGMATGTVMFQGRLLTDWSLREQAQRIGYVLQSPENQIVTDKVWHELAFGLESLGVPAGTIRLRVAEVASYFGIEDWFHQEAATLSGGQKQILNLASVLTMEPEVLILDEPTSQLDPLAASRFFAVLAKLNRDLGITVIISEHRLDELTPHAKRLIVMDHGTILADDVPDKAGKLLHRKRHPLCLAMPVPQRIWSALETELPCPGSVEEGRRFLERLSLSCQIQANAIPDAPQADGLEAAVAVKGVWFRYEKHRPDLLRGFSLTVSKGLLTAIVGGNGAGKTTLLHLIAGLIAPQQGTVQVDAGSVGYLPQQPQHLFIHKTLAQDLLAMLESVALREEEKRLALDRVAASCDITALLDRHPFDLSGGELQRAAIGKLLLGNPELLLLDEPTKGLDAVSKHALAKLLLELRDQGITILLVSHDLEFCARYADACALLFDGCIASQGHPRDFFRQNLFYTTAANRMARQLLPNAILDEDVILAFGGRPLPVETGGGFGTWQEKPQEPSPGTERQTPKKTPLHWKTILALCTVALTIPLTVWLGSQYLYDRKYYFITLLVMLESAALFLLHFESRKPRARELVILAVLCALAVASRLAFAWLPQCKPVTAIVVITGIAFGGEAGLLVGAFTAFLSGFFFGQGPWVPWQMLGLGFVGLLSGLLAMVPRRKGGYLLISILGGLAALVVYGGIVDAGTALMSFGALTLPQLLATYALGFPFNLLHGIATAVFLLLSGRMLLEKLDRVKQKYHLLE